MYLAAVANSRSRVIPSFMHSEVQTLDAIRIIGDSIRIVERIKSRKFLVQEKTASLT